MSSFNFFNRCFLYLFIFSVPLLKSNIASGQSNPVFQSSPVVTATFGSLYQYNIIVYDDDGDNIDVVLQSGNLPDGINLSKDKGSFLLEGTPEEAGDFPITLEVYKNKDPSYNNQQSFTIGVSKTTLSVTADNQNIVYGDAIPTLAISYSGFVEGDEEDDLETIPIASTTADANSSVGNYPINVSGGVSDNYDFTYTTGNLNIAKADQTITFDEILDKTYGDQDFALSASSDTGLPITFTVLSGPASISGNILTINGTGTVTVEASQDGDTNHEPATPVNRSFSVSKATLSVTADDQSIVYGDAIPTLTISYSGFINSENESNLITAPTASTTADENSSAGDYPITASGGVSDNYAFVYIIGTLSISNVNQTITFDEILDKTYGDQEFALSASSDSGLPITFTVLSGSASISGNILTINGAGTVTVEASQDGDANYDPATPVNRSFSISKTTLSVTADDQSIVYGDALPSLTLSYAGFVNNENESDLITAPTASTTADENSSAGDYPITASGGVSDNYAFVYINGTLSISNVNQTITFDEIPDKTYGDQEFALSASSDSGLPITFTVLSGPASISGNILTINGAGTVTVEASQDGDANYDPATPVNRSFEILKAEAGITISNTLQNFDGSPKEVTISTQPEGLNYNTTYNESSTLPTSAGTYSVEINIVEDNYSGQLISELIINSAPTTSGIPDQQVVENSNPIQLDLLNYFDDLEDEDSQLTFEVVNNTNPALFTQIALTNTILELIFEASTNGISTLTIRCTDSNGMFVEDEFEVEVTPPDQRPPFFTSTPVNEVLQNEVYEYFITTEDNDTGDELSISNNISLPAWLTLADNEDGTALLSGTPTNNNIGVYGIALRVSDDKGNTADQFFDIEVIDVNDPPTFISSPITTAEENQLYEYSIDVEDVDLNDIVVINVVQKPNWLNFDGETLLSGTPVLTDVGNSPFNVEIIATDLAGATDTQSFQIAVTLENLPPTLDPIIDPAAINEDSEQTFTINLTGITDGGENNQNISLEVSTDLPNLFEELYINYQSPNSTGELVYKILPDSFGIATVSVRVEDDGSGSSNFVENSLQIEVIAVNDIPIFVSSPIERIQANTNYRYDIETNDVDPDDELTIRKTLGPDWLVLVDNGDGTAVLEGEVPSNATNEEVSITVSDLQNASSTQSFTLLLNESPVVSDFTVQTEENVPYQFINSVFIDNYTDAEDDQINEIKLYFSRGRLQLGGSEISSGDPISFNENLDLQFTPPQGLYGDINLEWSASDGFVHSETANILMVVDTVNDKPILSNIENTTLEFIQGSGPIQITETITVSDIDNLTMDTVWIQIIENYNSTEDRLFLNDIDLIDIEYDYDRNSGLLLITGNASKSDYDLILRSVNYQNINSLSNDTRPKNISFIISDGENQSEPISREILLSSVLPELDFVNAFTPDGNSVNDTWDFKNLNAFEQVNISVYNSRGIMVYHCTTNNCEWDGNFNQKKLPPGTYFYLIKLNNGRRKYEGNVTILR
ncbi:MBG domain-containing protein [Marivirga sp.]|uniref:MBG domain-containing protein n=1 Tax=Marivirga sp. TaxID=2018662 RepID=UPI0025EA8174|nr:MBG domain-containing protein [Marivirga sp.]